MLIGDRTVRVCPAILLIESLTPAVDLGVRAFCQFLFSKCGMNSEAVVAQMEELIRGLVVRISPDVLESQPLLYECGGLDECGLEV